MIKLLMQTHECFQNVYVLLSNNGKKKITKVIKTKQVTKLSCFVPVVKVGVKQHKNLDLLLNLLFNVFVFRF